jgi:hypothetical protein
METLGTEAALQTVRGEPIDFILIFACFLAIMGFGVLFGKFNKSTRDFFFGGQRFPWWLIAMSLIASIVGSYSFVKYSRVAYEHGFCSTMTYMNDWFFMPLYLFIWIPVIYFSRVVSIPEYFKRRFDARVGFVAVCYVIFYMVGYIGINFFTLGKALQAMLGWPVFQAGPEEFLAYRIPSGEEIQRPKVRISGDLLQALRAHPGDLVYLCNRKWRYASLFSMHAVAGQPAEGQGTVLMPAPLFAELKTRPGEIVRLEKIL